MREKERQTDSKTDREGDWERQRDRERETERRIETERDCYIKKQLWYISYLRQAVFE